MIRAAIKSLLARKVRLLMSTFAIVLGVAFVAGTLIFSDTLNRSFTALFASTVGDVVVQPESDVPDDCGSTALTVPAALVTKLEALPDAARADGQISTCGVYLVGKDDKVVGGLGPPGLGGNYSDAPAGHGLAGLTITQGTPPSGPDEVAIDAETVRRGGYQVGDRVSVITPGTKASTTPTLVGIADFADGGSLNGASLVMWDDRTAQQLFLDGEDAYTSIWVTARDGVSQGELRSAAAGEVPTGVEAVTGDDQAEESASSLQESIGFLTTFLLIFAGISLVVGAFLIVNTFSILVAQRSRELALLRALGASARQVTRSVLLEALVLGLLGSTLGLLLGVGLAQGLKALFGNFGLDLSGQGLIFAPRTVLVSYAVGVLVTLAAAWFPARRTATIAPIQALRDDVALPESSLRRRFLLGLVMVGLGLVLLASGLFADLPYGGVQTGAGILLILLGVTAASPVISRPFIAAVRTVYARVFGTVGNLAGQNSLRNPRRTTATASALMIGLALASTMTIIGASAKASIDRAVEQNFVGDFIVSNVFGGPFSASVGDQIAEVPGVDKVVRQRYQLAKLDGDTQGIAAIDPSQVDDYELVADTGDLSALGDRTVIVQQSWAEDEGSKVGDTLTVTTPTGEKKWRIVGTFEDNPVVFFPIVASFDTLASAGYPQQDNALLVFTDDSSSATQDRLNRVVAALPIVSVKNQAEFAAEQREPVDQFVLIIYALLGLALLIAVLGIVNTLALSVIERTREVGLLRAIGLGRRQLRRMIMLESVLIALLGAVLGVILGLGFGVSLMVALRDEGLEVIRIPWGQIAAFLGLAVVIGVVAALLPARRAARLDVLDAISTE